MGNQAGREESSPKAQQTPRAAGKRAKDVVVLLGNLQKALPPCCLREARARAFTEAYGGGWERAECFLVTSGSSCRCLSLPNVGPGFAGHWADQHPAQPTALLGKPGYGQSQPFAVVSAVRRLCWLGMNSVAPARAGNTIHLLQAAAPTAHAHASLPVPLDFAGVVFAARKLR